MSLHAVVVGIAYDYVVIKSPFYKHGLTLIPAWISNYINYKVWDEITYPFPNFNGVTVEVWEWKSNFIAHFPAHMITYPCKSHWLQPQPGCTRFLSLQLSLIHTIISVKKWSWVKTMGFEALHAWSLKGDWKSKHERVAQAVNRRQSLDDHDGVMK